MKRKNWVIVLVLTLVVFANLGIASAQTCDPNIDPFCDIDPDDYPIDTNIYYLIGLTALMVVFKFKVLDKKSFN